MHHSLTGAAMLRLLALVLFTGNAFAQTGMTTLGQFSVNESGAATYTIPITIPPGIGGIEPKLALSYNSQAGNGLLGVGWSLSGLSAIGRCPQTMAQDGKRGGVKLDNDDRYCLDAQRLRASPRTVVTPIMSIWMSWA
ncbi:SpvB/TcaC N-terminal domain-containing protein [Herminiimonas glaciei]|uniref:SpvB/TcaC N-terminal domain-containing protein n=1 Tax=Herminiimonas glaciei TaxID=523788 RepID=A0ABW2I6I0_9BURK